MQTRPPSGRVPHELRSRKCSSTGYYGGIMIRLSLPGKLLRTFVFGVFASARLISLAMEGLGKAIVLPWCACER
jgi:hypothetical protein